MDSNAYDVGVIGAGPVGENVADRVVQGGLSVAIVERELVGGECSYWACTPTKALLRSAAALRAARQVPGAREAVTMPARDVVLPLAEPFAGERVTESSREAGVSVRLDAEAASVYRDEAGTVHVTMTDGEQVEADGVLVATGRIPNTQDIGPGAVGLTPGAWLTVNDTLRVVGEDGAPSDGWLYAVGDVNRRVLLTHQGEYQARAVGDVIVARAKGEAVEDGRHVATADERAVPQVVFTEPETASVGLTSATAETAGPGIRVVDYDLADQIHATHANRRRAQPRMDPRRPRTAEGARGVVGATP